jgi:hypothetical protein
VRLYLAGVGNYAKYLFGLDNLRFLVSYFYLAQNKDWDVVDFALDNDIPLMLDSGAWSALTSKQEIDNRLYVEFCKQHKDKFEVIVSLDVIGDWQTTKINHDEMQQAGIDSLPTFHIDSPFDELERLLEQNSYIGIGGIAGKGNQIKTRNWINYVNHLADGHKFHGFGVTTPNLLKLYDWYSVDGTTWMTGAIRYGRIMHHNEGRLKWIAVNNQRELEKNWHLIGNDIREGWTLENGRTEKYEKVSVRYNAKSLLDLVEYYSRDQQKELAKQDFLL